MLILRAGPSDRAGSLNVFCHEVVVFAEIERPDRRNVEAVGILPEQIIRIEPPHLAFLPRLNLLGNGGRGLS